MNICLWDMGYNFFKNIIAIFLLINPKIDIKTKVFDSLSFFTLFNSLLWAFSIPKIIHDEIYMKIILS